jgi:hypothetical protein
VHPLFSRSGDARAAAEFQGAAGQGGGYAASNIHILERLRRKIEFFRL